MYFHLGFFKEVLDTISYDVLAIINSSLATGQVSDCFKQVLVQPLLKKSNLNAKVLSNYRPISKLPFLGKVLEKSSPFKSLPFYIITRSMRHSNQALGLSLALRLPF